MAKINPLRSPSSVGVTTTESRAYATKKMPQVSSAPQNDAAIVAVAARDPGKTPSSVTERSYIRTEYVNMRSEVERVEQASNFEGLKLDSGGDDSGSGKKDP